ncbi:hypothetical protein OSB04_023707 [Centaurea solstitialis]|uniref:Uncharacterized protein n=1 Tax=Centaurea solstitialis TaxID=347529 RepID=A0AA38SX51_9ASTR|nr:hypothetical protein OSB04_023707 [Centaurea solstitialis]
MKYQYSRQRSQATRIINNVEEVKEVADDRVKAARDLKTDFSDSYRPHMSDEPSYSNNMAWVAWDKLINSRDQGSFGLGSLRTQNLVLLEK